jgi:hypothetical protein
MSSADLERPEIAAARDMFRAAPAGVAAERGMVVKEVGGALLFAARVKEAAEAGCPVAVTETGVRDERGPENSDRNILRAGFAEAYERPNWRSPG